MKTSDFIIILITISLIFLLFRGLDSPTNEQLILDKMDIIEKSKNSEDPVIIKQGEQARAELTEIQNNKTVSEVEIEDSADDVATEKLKLFLQVFILVVFFLSIPLFFRK